MNKLLWSFHILLSLAFGLFGMQKVVMPIPDLISQGMLWIEDFPTWQVRAIGSAEVLAVLGLNLPYLSKKLPRHLVPLAAAALALTMVGGIATHALRGDPALSIIINLFLLTMGVSLAKGRLNQLRAAQ